MSHYMMIRTAFRDAGALADAIAAIGTDKGAPIARADVEVHPGGAIMHGYQGATHTAHVIVRRRTCGGYGDMGYQRQPDGTLTLISDDLSGYRGDAWQAKLRSHYGCQLAKNEMKRRGIRYTQQSTAEGLPQLVATIR